MSKNKRGSALLLTTILLFVVLSLVVSLSYVTVMEQQMSSKTKSSVGSFFNADSGVEWALNKIANATGGTIAGVFGAINFNPDGSTYPFANAGYKVYLLDSEGKVITDLSKDISLVKAVRSVGTQTAGDPTQRAIEAAVGTGGGGGCYTSYGTPPGSADPLTGKCIQGFTNKGSIGQWGACGSGISNTDHFRPPGGGCWGTGLPLDFGEAFVCCL